MAVTRIRAAAAVLAIVVFLYRVPSCGALECWEFDDRFAPDPGKNITVRTAVDEALSESGAGVRYKWWYADWYTTQGSLGFHTKLLSANAIPAAYLSFYRYVKGWKPAPVTCATLNVSRSQDADVTIVVTDRYLGKTVRLFASQSILGPKQSRDPDRYGVLWQSRITLEDYRPDSVGWYEIRLWMPTDDGSALWYMSKPIEVPLRAWMDETCVGGRVAVRFLVEKREWSDGEVVWYHRASPNGNFVRLAVQDIADEYVGDYAALDPYSLARTFNLYDVGPKGMDVVSFVILALPGRGWYFVNATLVASDGGFIHTASEGRMVDGYPPPPGGTRRRCVVPNAAGYAVSNPLIEVNPPPVPYTHRPRSDAGTKADDGRAPAAPFLDENDLWWRVVALCCAVLPLSIVFLAVSGAAFLAQVRGEPSSQLANAMEAS